MLAFLKLIPAREWLMLAGLAILGLLFLKTYHDGELRIERKDAALRAAAVALNTAAANLAEIKEIQIGRSYEKIVQLGPVPNAGLVCHATAPVKSDIPDYRPEAPGTTAQLSDRGFDPSGAILTLLRDDDAQIDGLIDTVAVLQAELEGRTK